MKKIILTAIALLGATASGASAHVGEAGHVHGAVQGFMHPMGGVDHLAAMLAVGMFAAFLKGRAMWAVPASFLAMMVAGGGVGMAGFQLPYVEAMIMLSVVVLLGLVALRWQVPLALAMGLVGFFAVFHGFAHGVEMPADASGVGFAAGFVLSTGLLHGLGFLAGRSLMRASRSAVAE